MKRTEQLIAMVFLAAVAFTAAFGAPSFINYQGVLEQGGNPVPNDDYTVVFRIWNAEEFGDSIWGETHLVTTHGNNGKFKVKLGSIEGLTQEIFEDIDRWIGIEVYPDGEMDPRSQLGSVPFAFMASTVSDSAIDSTKIARKSIRKENIKDKAIDSTKIADKSIRKENIKDKAIDSTKIADKSIRKENIKDKAIDSTKIADKSIRKENIKDRAIDSTKIAQASIRGFNIKNKAIGKEHLADSVVHWKRTGNVLFTSDEYGIARAGNTLHGDRDSTHVNLGVESATGDPSYTPGAGIRYATVAGGLRNWAKGEGSTVSGGVMNEATGQYSVVSGGGGTGGSDGNLAHGDYSVIAGGRQNLVGSEIVGNNDYATVSGGQLNNAAGMHSTVGGGKQNTASSPYSTVSGGWNNTASGGETQEGATVGGGENNTASSYMATVGGGTDNHAVGPNSTVAGGQDNTAGGVSATVGGGEGNFAEADFTTIPGGRGNVALGDYSFAAGVGAKANHRGSVVIAAHVWGGGGRALDEDSVQTGGNSQMVLRADSLFYLTNTGEKAPPNPGGGGPGNRFLDTSTGAYLSKSGTWQNSSSMKLKENFADVEGKDILSRLETLNITRWNYKIDGEEVSHIGPVSQDFYAAFGLGTDDGTISTIDPSGVALAAIQELIRESERRNARIVELEAELDEMKALMHELMSERR